MFTPQKVIFPGIIIGSVILILTARLLTATQIASAATPEASTPVSPVQVDETQSAVTCTHSFPEKIAPWCELIENAAQTHGISPYLIAAVMLQESGGQSEVISASGAVGLMQVMPSDGLAAGFMCASGPCFASRPTTQQLLDPAFNVDFGTRMLAGLIQKYGSEREALKAYGPYDVGYYYADKVLTIRQSIEANYQ
jgi:soluble lytic murein transglycosylase-like protein